MKNRLKHESGELVNPFATMDDDQLQKFLAQYRVIEQRGTTGDGTVLRPVAIGVVRREIAKMELETAQRSGLIAHFGLVFFQCPNCAAARSNQNVAVDTDKFLLPSLPITCKTCLNDHVLYPPYCIEYIEYHDLDNE